jgi:hypothetical protein
MSKISFGPNLAGSRPHRVLLFCRCSAEITDQSAAAADRKLDDQEAQLRDWVASNMNVEVEIGVARLLDSCSNRPQVREHLAKAIGTGKWDVILVTGLDRIRGLYYLQEFLKMAADDQTRIIAVAEAFDSGDPDWLITMTFAALSRESDRIERLHRLRRQRFDRVNNPDRFLRGLGWGD